MRAQRREQVDPYLLFINTKDIKNKELFYEKIISLKCCSDYPYQES